MGINRATLMGYITTDPEVTKTDTNTIVRFTMSTNVYRANRMNSDFHFIQSFGPVAEYAEKYLEKGDYTFVEGYLVAGKYKNKSGYEVRNYTVHANKIEIIRKRTFSAKGRKKKETDEEIAKKQKETPSSFPQPYYDNNLMTDDVDLINGIPF